MNKTNIILRSLVVVTLISSFIAVLLSSLFPIVTYGAQTGGQDHPPKVSNVTLPINLTKPNRVNFNGSDPDKNDTMTFYIVRQPTHGKLGNITGKTVNFTADHSFKSNDSFTYRAKDSSEGKNSTNEGTVTLLLTDHPPKVPDLIISTNGTRPLKLNFNGSDPDRNDRLKFFILQRPINGLLSNVSGNSSTYTPNPGFTGLDKFIYRAIDFAGLSSNNGTVTIKVNAAPQPIPSPSIPPPNSDLIYILIITGAMIAPVLYDMRKGYAHPTTDGRPTYTDGLGRTVMAFAIIILLAILIFNVVTTITYNIHNPPNSTGSDIVKQLVAMVTSIGTLLGGAVSSIIGFYFGSKALAARTESGSISRKGGAEPTVDSTTPSDGDQSVQTDTLLKVTFDQPVTIEKNSLSIMNMNNNALIKGTTVLSIDRKTLTLDIGSEKLTPATPYSVTITGVKNKSGVSKIGRAS